MEIIIPAAGLSTRFPNMRPKYTLVDYTGNMMVENSFAPYLGQYQITVGVLAENEKNYGVAEYFEKKYQDRVRVVVLDNKTDGPADTVYQIIKKSGINLQQEILIRDCDSFFEHDHQIGNYVCVNSLVEHETLKNPAAKSYVISNNQGIIVNIIEKQIISDKFCVGGYKFQSAEMYMSAYEGVANGSQEIFVSHVIEKCLAIGEIFKEVPVSNYVDVGTADDWYEFNDKNVVFCDIDGTIVKAQHRKDFEKTPEPLHHNIQRVKELAQHGGMVVFTTARPDSARDTVHAMLVGLGFENFKLITGLPNTKRILINDYNAANPYPRAIAVNVKRDSDTLSELI